MSFNVVLALCFLTLAIGTIGVSSKDNTTIPEKPIRHEICQLPKDVGKGRARIQRYYFDTKSETCKKLIFGGGVGNANNFPTKKDCEMLCADTISAPPVTPTKEPMKNVNCTLPKETGKGRAAFPRFFYNSKSGKCEEFTWGGVGGNANNFETKEECEEKCGNGKETKPTFQPASTQASTVMPTTMKPKKSAKKGEKRQKFKTTARPKRFAK